MCDFSFVWTFLIHHELNHMNVNSFSKKASELHMSKRAAHFVAVPGDLLLRALKSLVLFLIPCSIINGISTLSGGSTGRLGLKAFGYYLTTTTIAATCGIGWVSLIRPGYYYASKIKAPSSLEPVNGTMPSPPLTPIIPHPVGNAADSVVSMLFSFVPDNIIVAMANLNILGLISVSIALGIVINQLGSKAKPVLKLVKATNEIVNRMIELVLYYVPIGVCFIIISKLGESETGTFIQKLEALGLFAATVAVGLLVHGYLIIPLIYFLCTRKNPYAYIKGLAQPLLTALGTASSAATLPITMRAVKKLGITPVIADFMLPFGATISMDGTALYEGVAAIFIAQLTGKTLGPVDLITISITATLAAIGAAGVPEAGLITISIVLTAVGLPLDNIGLLLTIDWFLDRLRTSVNVMGDSFGCAVIDHFEKDKITKDLQFTSPPQSAESVDIETAGTISSVDVDPTAEGDRDEFSQLRRSDTNGSHYGST
jgi:Na+/H+-dicarboxylate symporter